MGTDNYPVAAVRHFVDGHILLENGRVDNAMCHFAFALECALKIWYGQLSKHGVNALGHKAYEEWNNITQYMETLQMLDAKAGVLLAAKTIPKPLYLGHPGRRYAENYPYLQEDVKESEELVDGIIQKIVLDAIDGRIEIKG